MSMYTITKESRTITVDTIGYPDWKLPYRSATTIRPDMVVYNWASTDGAQFTLEAARVYGQRVLKSGDVSETSRHDEYLHFGSFGNKEAPEWVAELADSINQDWIHGEKWPS